MKRKRKILFNHRLDGSQHLLDSLGVSSDQEILWDEKVDGAFPEDKIQYLGGLVRSNDQIEVDQDKWDAYQAALQAKADKKALVQTIRNKLKNGELTQAQQLKVMRKVLFKIMEEMDLDLDDILS